MKDLSSIRQKVGKLIRERYRLENDNIAVRDMIKGSVIKHYKKCGRKRCICRRGKLHGPYWYLVYKDKGKAVLKYIEIKELARVKKLSRKYKTFQRNLTKISRANREVMKLMGNIREIVLTKRQ